MLSRCSYRFPRLVNFCLPFCFEFCFVYFFFLAQLLLVYGCILSGQSDPNYQREPAMTSWFHNSHIHSQHPLLLAAYSCGLEPSKASHFDYPSKKTAAIYCQLINCTAPTLNWVLTVVVVVARLTLVSSQFLFIHTRTSELVHAPHPMRRFSELTIFFRCL